MLATIFIINRVQLVHRGMTGFGAAESLKFMRDPRQKPLLRDVTIQIVMKVYLPNRFRL